MSIKDNIPTQSFITRAPYPRSKKIHVKGKLHDIKVAMREIELDDSDPEFSTNGNSNKNYPLTVYDTSGPYTDPNVEIDVSRGLPSIREKCILERGDIERLADFSSEFGRKGLRDSKLDEIRFKHIKKPLRAKAGKTVTQMHYARRGSITPEMEYISIRENQRIDELGKQMKDLARYHKGEGFGANMPDTYITPEFVRQEVASGRAIIPSNIKCFNVLN
jgi:phosphomethylpyrimidine synthase